jgi:hypothetical protein
MREPALQMGDTAGWQSPCAEELPGFALASSARRLASGSRPGAALRRPVRKHGRLRHSRLPRRGRPRGAANPTAGARTARQPSVACPKGRPVLSRRAQAIRSGIRGSSSGSRRLSPPLRRGRGCEGGTAFEARCVLRALLQRCAFSLLCARHLLSHCGQQCPLQVVCRQSDPWTPARWNDVHKGIHAVQTGRTEGLTSSHGLSTKAAGNYA